MPTTGSITKTIRINPRDLEVIEGLMADGTSWSGAIHKLCEGVPQNIKETLKGVPQQKEGIESEVEEVILSDIRVMCGLSGINLGKFMKKLDEAMNAGYVWYENGRLRTKDVDGVDFEGFKEVCKEKGVDVQSMINRCTQMLLRT